MSEESPPAPRPAARPAWLCRRMSGRTVVVLLAAVGVIAAVGYVGLARPRTTPFADLRHIDPEVADEAIERIEAGWRPESVAMALEITPFLMHHGHEERLYDLLRRKSGQSFRVDQRQEWYTWLWTQPAPDPVVLNRMRYQFYSTHSYPFGSLAGYFAGDPATTIRADEIVWGGVLRDGIPPIRQPHMVPAAQAAFLADTDLVYGIVVNGDARAYPRRILGHHEMVIDTVGGEPITGVYCTLCETMIAYSSRTADGTVHEFGTSGFLYRSNKLMYDAATLSLWSTLTGKPVVGRLVGTGAALEPRPVVTTTWGEWRALHPDTRVLSLEDLPGNDDPDVQRPNYAEGVAYRAYHASDSLMFAVPGRDARLKIKDEVFVLRLDSAHPPTAVATAFLREHPVHHLRVGERNVAIVTTPGGANRAYAVADQRFSSLAADGRVVDATGTAWELTEDGLRSGAMVLPRVPAHRAYWFGWQAAHPDTVLVK